MFGDSRDAEPVYMESQLYQQGGTMLKVKTPEIYSPYPFIPSQVGYEVFRDSMLEVVENYGILPSFFG